MSKLRPRCLAGQGFLQLYGVVLALLRSPWVGSLWRLKILLQLLNRAAEGLTALGKRWAPAAWYCQGIPAQVGFRGQRCWFAESRNRFVQQAL